MVPASRRVYPQGELAGQVIGTVGVDGQGLTGLEAADNTILGGTNGERGWSLDGLGEGDRAQHDFHRDQTARTSS